MSRMAFRRTACLSLALACVRSAAAAPASLIADLPDVGDEGEEDMEGDFVPMDGGGYMMYEDGGMMYEDGDMYYGEEPEDVEEQLRVLFSRFDANQDERLDVAELRAALHAQAQHYQSAAAESAFSESEEILRRADEDGDGKLNEHEFERMETLYLHHERAIGRRALFLFADGGEAPAGGGDGLVEASELQVLVFPESHPRGSELGRLMAGHVLKARDLPRSPLKLRPHTRLSPARPPPAAARGRSTTLTATPRSTRPSSSASTKRAATAGGPRTRTTRRARGAALTTRRRRAGESTTAAAGRAAWAASQLV